MAKFPYISSQNSIIQIVEQFRKNFPSNVTSDTLKRLEIAPNNEAFLINILKFLDLLSDDGGKTSHATEIFSKHEDSEFQSEFSGLLEKAYADLFSLHGNNAWNLEKSKLIAFFRNADKTSEVIGTRQANTFQALSALGGHGEMPQTQRKPSSRTSEKTSEKGKKSKQASTAIAPAVQIETEKPDTLNSSQAPKTRDFGLTVRIEINLPVTEDQTIYDKIFRSIRENLINGE